MAATMSMNKVIHCAVRRDLRRFRAALAAYADGDRERAEALHRAWANFDAQLTEHHEGEHEIAWPAMREIGIEPELLDTFDHEHGQMAAALATAREAMARLRTSAARSDADAAVAAMADLEATTTAHLDHEEQTTEPAYAEHHDHPAVKAMGKQFGRRMSIAASGAFLAWVEDGASAEEKAGLRGSVPGPVVTIVGGLFGRAYRREIAPVWRVSTPG